MISYAQNFEDVMLWRALKNVKNGFYVDVGAGRPELDSVTKHFYAQGWRGINIEPHSEDFLHLAAARPRDLNLNIAIGPQKGAMTFYQNKIRGWSTLDRGTAAEMLGLGGDSLEVQVECFPLQEVLDQHSGGPIHFLKIDVEGYEEEVLKSLDLKKSRPWVIVLEAADIHGRLPDPSKSFLQLGKNGYELVYTDALNFFYISLEKLEELKPHFQQPPNIFDGFVHLNSRDHQQTAQFEDLRKFVSEGQASVESLKAENLTLAQQRKAQQEEVEKSVGGLKKELAKQREAQQEEVAKLVGGLKKELAKQREAQQEEVAKLVGGLKKELAKQREAQQEEVAKLVGGLKKELAQQRKAQQEAVEKSVGEVKREIVAEIHSLIANLGEQVEKNRLAVSARIDSVEEGMGGRIVEVAEYATKIQEAVVSPSSYLIPAPFSWYSYLYKMMNIRRPNWINKRKESVLESKRAGFWRRLERSIRKRIKMLAAAWNFDPVWYLETYPEVSAAGVEPLSHYINFGKQEGRQKNKSHNGIGMALIRMVKALRKSSLTTAPEIFLEPLESAFWVVTLKQTSSPLEGLVRITARNRRDEVRLSGGSENKKDHRILLKLTFGIQKISLSFEDKYEIQKTVVTKITRVSNAKESKPDNIISQKYDTFVDLSVKPARATIWRQIEARLRNKRKAIFSKPLVTIQRQALNERGGFPAVALALNQQADRIFKEISRRDA